LAKKTWTALTEDCIGWVPGDLVLGGISDEALGVGEGDVGWGGSCALVVGDDLDVVVLPDTDAAVGRAQVDPDDRCVVVAGHLATSGGRHGGGRRRRSCGRPGSRGWSGGGRNNGRRQKRAGIFIIS
jgi:hypothetical protein